jgi:hypothetical protein
MQGILHALHHSMQKNETLSMNKSYRGLYLLTEKISASPSRLNISPGE